MPRNFDQSDRRLPNRIENNYAQFWVHYLREHGRAKTRYWHFFGTVAAFICLAALVITGNLWFLAAAIVGGYTPAWVAHMIFEKNQPATFVNPFWSLVSDVRMFGLWLTDGLSAELERAGVPVRRSRDR